MQEGYNTWVVNVEGLELLASDQPIEVGDMYVAKRNIGKQLLRAKKIMDGYIIPDTLAYCYNIRECIRVTLS